MSNEEVKQEYIAANPLEGIDVIIDSPAELRRTLLNAMSGLAEGRIEIARANALVGLSGEVHKSIRTQWDMKVYAAEHLQMYGTLRNNELPLFIGEDDDL